MAYHIIWHGTVTAEKLEIMVDPNEKHIFIVSVRYDTMVAIACL